MPTTNRQLTAAARDYFAALPRARSSGGALRPKVFCVSELADQGAGHPDMGLYSARQVQRGRPRHGQTPERGVVEVKAPDAWLISHDDA